MEYIIASSAVVDEIYFTGSSGESPMLCPGGAGLYAASGAMLWAKDVYLLCGKGCDFTDTLGPFFTEQGMSDTAMFPVDAATPRTTVQYLSDGERSETPYFGNEHYQRFRSGIAEIAKHCKGCRGMYVFREATEEPFWEKLLSLKKQYGFSLLWEIHAYSARPELQKAVAAIAAKVDIFSINRTEAKQLFAVEEEECVKHLADIGAPVVFFRRGRDGAFMISGKQLVNVPPETGFPTIDPTGAGNSSSGAVLVGFCQGRTLEEMGFMGSIAAGMTIAQHGPAETGCAALRDEAARLLEKRRSQKGGKE
jgi:sugar/nucleoside kinase (ribokinase family)